MPLRETCPEPERDGRPPPGLSDSESHSPRAPVTVAGVEGPLAEGFPDQGGWH
jgi:hypothetical protein